MGHATVKQGCCISKTALGTYLWLCIVYVHIAFAANCFGFLYIFPVLFTMHQVLKVLQGALRYRAAMCYFSSTRLNSVRITEVHSVT